MQNSVTAIFPQSQKSHYERTWCRIIKVSALKSNWGRKIVLKGVFFSFIRKTSDNGFNQHWIIKYGVNRNRHRTNYVKVHGTCCWEIMDRNREKQEFRPGQEEEPRVAYISRIKSKKCDWSGKKCENGTWIVKIRLPTYTQWK